jgi:hypothetical protein
VQLEILVIGLGERLILVERALLKRVPILLIY